MSSRESTDHAVDLPPRRSALAGRFDAGGVVYEGFGDTRMPVRFPGVAPLDPARAIGLFDLSHAARFGLKGPGAAEWLAEHGLSLPDAVHAVTNGADGIAARIAAEESLLLGQPWAESPALAAVEAAWVARDPEAAPRLVRVPWREGHAWLCLVGEQTWRLMRHLCALDLRPQTTAARPLLMTSMAGGVTVTLVATPLGATHALHVLVDRGYAEYLCETLFRVAQGYELRLAARDDWPAGG